MERFSHALQGFGIGRFAVLLGVTVAVGLGLFFMVFNMGSAPKSLLYANLDLKEAAAISEALDQAGVKYEAKGDGSTIMVDRDKVASTRLMLSSKGMPTSGSVGYEIFDETNALGQTEFVQNLNRQRALEGELAKTIRSLEGVTFARVQLVLPKRQLFEEESEQPTASVVIGAGRQVSQDQVRALQNLVASAVPGLVPDRVTIVDQAGKLLGGGSGSDALGAVAEERRSETEEAIKRKIRELVEGVVGPGKARVNVTAELDLARVTLQEENFNPDGQVARSTQNVSETTRESQPGVGGGVSATNNLPGGDAGIENSASGSGAERLEETTNYEISKTVRTEVIEPGSIKKLSVAVAVDGLTAAAGAKGPAYTPRTAEEMQRIEQLVRSAVGFNAERGDQISVINVQFARDPAAEGGAVAASPLAAFDKNDIMRGAELAVLAIVAGLLIFFVARPLLKSAASGGGMGGMPMLAGSSPGLQGLPAPAGHGAYDQPNGQAYLPPQEDSRIDIARIEGQVKASAVKQVSEFVERHPEESVSILRSWLHEA